MSYLNGSAATMDFPTLLLIVGGIAAGTVMLGCIGPALRWLYRAVRRKRDAV